MDSHSDYFNNNTSNYLSPLSSVRTDVILKYVTV